MGGNANSISTMTDQGLRLSLRYVALLLAHPSPNKYLFAGFPTSKRANFINPTKLHSTAMLASPTAAHSLVTAPCVSFVGEHHSRSLHKVWRKSPSLLVYTLTNRRLRMGGHTVDDPTRDPLWMRNHDSEVLCDTLDDSHQEAPGTQNQGCCTRANTPTRPISIRLRFQGLLSKTNINHCRVLNFTPSTRSFRPATSCSILVSVSLILSS